MKRLIATAVAFLVFTAGCTSSPKPTPEPSTPPTSSASIKSPEPSVEPTEDETDSPVTPPRNDETNDPKPSPTLTGEEPPATQFLKRWGQQYPAVQEAYIMKAGSVTCDLIKETESWENNNTFNAVVQDTLIAAGMTNASLTTAANFAVDANQNLCPNIS